MLSDGKILSHVCGSPGYIFSFFLSLSLPLSLFFLFFHHSKYDFSLNFLAKYMEIEKDIIGIIEVFKVLSKFLFNKIQIIY